MLCLPWRCSGHAVQQHRINVDCWAKVRSTFILLNKQHIQPFAVNFIPLPGSLYMFRVFYTPIISSTIFNCIYSLRYKSQYRLSCLLPAWPGTRPRWKKAAEIILWFVPEAVDTVKNCTPDDGCVKRPKHVEWTWQWNKIDCKRLHLLVI